MLQSYYTLYKIQHLVSLMFFKDYLVREYIVVVLSSHFHFEMMWATVLDGMFVPHAQQLQTYLAQLKVKSYIC